MINNHENCGKCALQKTCEKATHIENYHINGGCIDFISEEEYVDKMMRAAKVQMILCKAIHEEGNR